MTNPSRRTAVNVADGHYRGQTGHGEKVALDRRRGWITGFFFVWRARCSDCRFHSIKSVVRRPRAIAIDPGGHFRATVTSPSGANTHISGHFGEHSVSGQISHLRPARPVAGRH
jgi:hypothetical protein